MAKEIINVKINPKEVLKILNEKLPASKADSSIFELDGGKYIINSVYEKFFIRGGSCALIVTAENVTEKCTKVKIVSAGTDRDIGLNIGPGGKFRKKAMGILKEYIIDKRE